MAKVSIIVPVYNSEKYLEKCLISVISQTMKDIEIILINDGSTDNSLVICEKYAEVDKRIKLINQHNQGIAMTRNIGAAISRGEYICFVDSDDWIDSEMIERLYDLCKVNNVKFGMCNYIKEQSGRRISIDSCINKTVLEDSEIISSLLLPLIERDDEHTQHNLEGFRSPWGKLIKKELIKENNIIFKKDLVIGEDFLFNLEILMLLDKVAIDKHYYYHYFINDNSTTMRYKKDCWELIYKKIILHLTDFLKKNSLYSKANNRLNKLVIKYFLLSIYNETRKGNKKRTIEKINSIKEMCEDDIIISALKQVDSKLFRKREKLVLFLARYKIILLVYIISII